MPRDAGPTSRQKMHAAYATRRSGATKPCGGIPTIPSLIGNFDCTNDPSEGIHDHHYHIGTHECIFEHSNMRTLGMSHGVYLNQVGIGTPGQVHCVRIAGLRHNGVLLGPPTIMSEDTRRQNGLRFDGTTCHPLQETGVHPDGRPQRVTPCGRNGMWGSVMLCTHCHERIQSGRANRNTAAQ